MRAFACAAVVCSLALAPLQAQAGALGATVAGGVIGGVAGSVYVSGTAATASSVGAGITGAAAAVPAMATGAAALVAATSTPILVGVAGGTVVGYLLYSLVN